MKRTTLCYLIHNGRVLLAMKKRGFGAGKRNGPGGKVEDGETAEDACRRETKEEVGVTIGAMEDRGVVRFEFIEKPEWNTDCSIFVSRDFNGDPVETEEMRPAWYPVDALPLTEMWADDAYWLEGVLRGGRVDATFWFDGKGNVVKHEDRGS
jgi:8-oxo-dGTP pyrophosphatase MutT (NUDIX family)